VFIWALDWPLAELAALPRTFRPRSPRPAGSIDNIVNYDTVAMTKE
jgi:hypothetical protein